QFAFGIKKHPASVRDFVRFMDIQYPVKPKSILLVGRGMTYIDQRIQENNPLYETLGPVPTFGWPASDILLVSQPGTAVPITPVGRIGAINGAEVGNYLQKVIQYETAQRNPSCTIADKAWMKNSMNIVGGINQIESNTFGFYMDSYKAIYQDTLMGGKVETFNKTSVATVQQASSARITELFQEGLGVISYFGHSSASVFEFNLSSPEVYNNTGKYPFFCVSGCTAGNYYTFDPQRVSQNSTLSDKYILTPQKGSIGFLADTHFGIPFALHNYNTRLYKNFSTLMYGQRVGDQIKEVTSFLGGGSPALDYYTRIHVEEINLHGDPAIKINNFPKPDYVVEDQTVKISPSIISLADPTFNLKIGIRNIGRAINDSIRINVKRLLPNTTVPVTYLDTLLKAPKNADSLNLNIPINPLTDKGQNRLIVEVDWTNRVSEICENNNIVIKDFFIFEDELRPIYPYNYAIVNSQNTVFSASTANPLVGMRNYIMEMDTTELFNSPFKKTFNTSGIGGVIQFTPTNTVYTDSVVYYWRTAVVPSGGNIIWNNASFVFISTSSPGYNMSHYYQFAKNVYQDINLGTDRRFRFNPRVAQYTVRTAVFPFATNTDEWSLSNDGFIEQSGFSSPVATNMNSLRFYIIDSITLKPWFNTPVGGAGQFGSYAPNPLNASMKAGYYQFDISTAASRQVVKNFLTNSVPGGNYIVLVNCPGNVNNHYPAAWATDPGANMYLALKDLGFNQIDQITSHVPFVFIGKKGNTVAVSQLVGTAAQKLTVNFDVPGFKLAGTITSDIFGPAARWNALHWRGTQLEAANNDRTAVQVIGLNASGAEVLLTTVNPARDTSLTWIDAVTYPRLKLKMLNTDSVTGTPHQLRYFLLNADLYPEGAVAPNIRFTMKDTVEAGEAIDFSLAFKNVTPLPFTALMKVNMRIRTSTNFDSVINIAPLRILAPSPDTIVVSYRIPTEFYPGNNSLFVEFNPNNDQPEQFHFNNLLYKDFFVKSDRFNPLLDVTFDGVHILSRDIVSSKPNILIKLKDESRFLALKDTALLKVQLRYPDQSLHTYYFNGDTMRFIPADLSAGENSATIEFKPTLPEDGEYELIVSGKDASGNPAGYLNYRTVFTVINKPMISEMLNYPNPFTTSTAFVFTLTGSRVPQNLRIQVLTITGKVVREITKEELGPIHVGRNISEFKWDGTDMYGQKLANGVYIYRVITNLEGKSLDKYKAEGDNTDKFFNKGYGKMYLMR
ncbi:MAG: C25 family cysteine peptidase, partial [Ferruginibacter sp.]